MRIAGSTLVAIMLLTMAGAAAAADAPANSTQHDLTMALQASMAQVELGKLAQKNAQSTGVNALGARLQRDHTRIGKAFAAVVRNKGMVVPAALESDQRAEIEALSVKRGADFDIAYVEQMVSNHEDAIVLFTALANGSDPELGRLAKSALPLLQEDQRLVGSYEKLNNSGPVDNVPALARQ
jgi:putative membrane protein